MQPDDTQTKDIAPKYLALVERYKAVPLKSVERIKMMLDFMAWFRSNRDKLTDDEKEYLQSNITKVDCSIPKYYY